MQRDKLFTASNAFGFTYWPFGNVTMTSDKRLSLAEFRNEKA